MSFDFYIVSFTIISIAFAFIIFALIFSSYNKRILKKSYMDTRLYIYIVFLSAVLYVGTIFYAKQMRVVNNISYVIFALIFVAYALSIMLTLFVALRPLKKIEISTNLLAKGKKNLNIDFEGSVEFDSISKNLDKVQQIFRENDKKLNKKDIEYQKFIASEYLKFFEKNRVEELNVGDNVQVKLSTLFCDMRNSYFSSETLSLADNFEIIKDFLQLVSENIKKNHGFVDKFLGDGVLAVFENEDDCLNAGIDIARQLDYKNLVSVGKEPIKFGISLNSGVCVVGVVGTEKQKQFSVVGDVVNLCSRIENLNKIFGTRVLMTKNFMSNVKTSKNFRYIGTIEFDDLTSKIPVFESLDAYSDSKKNAIKKYLQEFESGVRFFEKGGYEKAKQFFAFCLKKDGENSLAKYYLSKTIGEMSKLLPSR